MSDDAARFEDENTVECKDQMSTSSIETPLRSDKAAADVSPALARLAAIIFQPREEELRDTTGSAAAGISCYTALREMSTDNNNRKRSHSPPNGDQPEGNEHSEQQGRQRSRAACVPCRQRKRKCDGRMPCSTCVRYEYQCVYNTTKRASYAGPGDLPQELPQPANVGHTKPSRIQLQPHPLTAPGARFHHRGILDPTKTRFVRANSAIAFPRILAMDLDSDTVPRLHSFAWHLGIRTEPSEALTEITSLLSWNDMQTLAKVYFAIVRPEIGHIDEHDFMETAAVRFENPQPENDFDGVILGVAALGSFFSSVPHPAEEDFVYHANKLLTQKSMLRSPTPNIVSAFILRTLYLRLMSRPHAAWISSCVTLHQAEACGLHKELQTIAVVYPSAPMGDHKLAKTRRRLFWLAKALNTILSFEYGRSRVHFEVVTTKKFAAENGTHAHHFVELADLLPSDIVDPEREPDPPAALSAALTGISEMQSESAFINMLRADLAFGIYRRLWLMSLTDAKDRADSVMTIGKAALEAAARMVESRTPWWNILGSTFQFLLTVLAIGTPKSLAHVAEIMNQLGAISQAYDTHMVREAYNQALALANMAKKRKEKELEALSSVTNLTPFDDPPTTARSSSMSEPPQIEWGSTEIPFEWDWDLFLNPSLVVSSQQGQVGSEAVFGGPNGFAAPESRL